MSGEEGVQLHVPVRYTDINTTGLSYNIQIRPKTINTYKRPIHR